MPPYRRNSPCMPRRLAGILGVMTLAAVSLADARMYQWVNDRVGSTQLSGTPPSWYRSQEGGPRVRVFENGNLVDDTAIRLPRTQARELRDAAFAEYEQRQRAEALRQLERTAAAEQRRQEQARSLAQQQREQALAAASTQGQPEPETASKVLAVPEDPRALTPEAVERLKALLTEFDKQGGAASK